MGGILLSLRLGNCLGLHLLLFRNKVHVIMLG